MKETIGPFVELTDVIDHPYQLQSRAKRDGYLFFRALIDSQAVLDLRRDFAEICNQHGWIKPDTDPMDAIWRGKPHGPYREGDEDFWFVLDAFQSLESFHTFAHYPTIIDVCDKLFGEPTLVHPRNIGAKSVNEC